MNKWLLNLRLYENDDTDLITDDLEATIFNNKLLSDPRKYVEVEGFLKILQSRDITNDASLNDRQKQVIYGVMGEAEEYLKAAQKAVRGQV